MTKFFNKNKPNKDWTCTRGRIVAPSKWGKSGLIEAINRWFHPEIDTIAVISAGREDGNNAVESSDERVLDYKKFLEVKKDIIENADEYKKQGIKMFALDTEDTALVLTDEEAIEIYNKERDPSKQKKARTINGAFGGYTRGQRRSVGLLMDILSEIYDEGFGIITLGHAQQKEMKDKEANITFTQTTSSLMKPYNTELESFADWMAIGCYEYIIADDEQEELGFEEGEIMETKRMLHLTAKATKSIGSGSRFLGLPEFIEFETYEEDSTPMEKYETTLRNGKVFMDVFTEALKVNANVREEYKRKLSKDSPKPSTDKEEEVEDDTIVEDVEIELLTGKELVDELRDKVTKEKAKNKKTTANKMKKIIGLSDLKEIARMITDEEIDEQAVKDLNNLL